MAKELSSGQPPVFEQIKRLNDQGMEYWSARDLAKVLDYSEYRHFLPAIERAKEACTNSGQKVEDHFEDILEMIEIGKGGKRSVQSVELSRYACYFENKKLNPPKK